MTLDNPRLLAQVVDDIDEARALAAQLLPNLDQSSPRVERHAQLLWAMAEQSRGSGRRQSYVSKYPGSYQASVDMKERTVAKGSVVQHLKLLRAQVPRVSLSITKWATRGALLRYETRNDPNARKLAEEQETHRWAIKLAEVLKDLDLPRSRMAKDSCDPLRFLERSSGRLRAKTIRMRLRMFLRFQTWLRISSGLSFPAKITQISDYCEERAMEPCGKTVPQSILEAMAFMEDKGGVAKTERLSLDPSLTNTIQSITRDLERAAPLTVKAPSHLLVPMVSMELFVVNTEHPLYARAFAWLKLVKIWAALRTDDVSGLLPSTMLLTQRGLQGWLDRTKTSGAGRRIRWMPIFVSRGAFVAQHLWLEVGWSIWQSVEFNIDRDYFLPLANATLDGVKHSQASYHDQMIASGTLYSILRRPVSLESIDDISVDEQIFESSEVLLDLREAQFFWKEHSERKTLNGMAAQLGIPKSDRDFLGRWVPEQSDDYLLTARSVVAGIQEKVARQLRVSPTLIDETETLDSFRKHLLGNGLNEQDTASFLDKFDFSELNLAQIFGTHDPEGLAVSQNFLVYPCEEFGESMSREEARWIHYQEVSGALTDRAVEDEDVITDQFVVNTSNKSGLRTLHLIGGCWRRIGYEFKNYETHYSLEGLRYDSFCKLCWKSGTGPDAVESSDEDGSESSSSAGSENK
jgi:hypothetical protein